jgi:phosphatidylglycerophosphatase A
MTIQRAFLTFFGAGLSPKAPGTVGTLVALPFGVALLYYLGMESLFMATLAITIIGIFEINKYEKATGDHDQSEIVIDEAAGIWITMMVAYPTAMGLEFSYALPLAIALSFATFRLFDIWKPSTIGWIDRNAKGGLGVMGDDILAGFAAGFLTIVLLKAIESIL